MIIGTDISIEVSKEEGYLLAEYDGRKPFTPETQIRFFNYYPRDIRKWIGLRSNSAELMLDTRYTYKELLEEYEKHKKGIDSFCDVADCWDLDDPDYFTALQLADSVNAYCGLY